MEENVKTKKPSRSLERVVISDKLKDKLKKLVLDANEAMQGMAEISKSDILNLLLEEQSEELSVSQIKKLKAAHIDQVKYAYWIAEQLKRARDAGEAISIQDILAKSQHVFVEKRKTTRKPRKVNEQNQIKSDEV